MRFAFIEENFVVSGGMRRIIEISNRLVEKGHEVDILIVLDNVPLECDWLEVKANIIRFKDRRDYDIAIFNHAPVWIVMDTVVARLKVYYWLNFEGAYFTSPTWYDAYKYDCFIVANSHWTADCAKMVYGKRPPVVHGGIDKKLFRPIDVEKEYDIVSIVPEDKPEKGGFYVKRVCEIGNWKLGNIVGLRQEDMAEAYSKGKIFLGMPECEGFYNPALEAMACGVPVVLTDACGNMDYAVDGKNCLIIPRNVGAAMQAIKEIQESPSLQKELIKNGFETVKQYNWDKAGSDFEKVVVRELNGSN